MQDAFAYAIGTRRVAAMNDRQMKRLAVEIQYQPKIARHW